MILINVKRKETIMGLPDIASSYNVTTFPIAAGYPERFVLPDDQTDWNTSARDYQPTNYTAELVLGADWADPTTITPAQITDRLFDGDRLEYWKNDLPLCPHGRTGIEGRGLLGRFGPNYLGVLALISTDKSKVLVVRRTDAFYGLPGGYANAGETNLVQTATRETREEIIPSYRPNSARQVGSLLMLPDPKTTDHAWIMAGIVADVVNIDDVNLIADGTEVRKGEWVSTDKAFELIFPAHKYFLKQVLQIVR